ncbi:hypothetical protein GBF38_001132 [Nibea albiflora]|uniref:Uncharacterized protein n=1 Tax=Nibea albiflora TaxID=240163 RepID=A0ACB7ETN1_NIBAL|nr:hypothetical protein GBF38_001132 [Nibea albiflora]
MATHFPILTEIPHDTFHTEKRQYSLDSHHCQSHLSQLVPVSKFTINLQVNPDSHSITSQNRNPNSLSNILNLATLFTPSPEQLSLLERGLSFIPRPTKLDREELQRDLHNFHRRLKLTDHFHPNNNSTRTHTLFTFPSHWEPPSNQIHPHLRKLIITNTRALQRYRPPADIRDNLTGDFHEATHTLFHTLRRRGYSKRLLRHLKTQTLALLAPTRSPTNLPSSLQLPGPGLTTTSSPYPNQGLYPSPLFDPPSLPLPLPASSQSDSNPHSFSFNPDPNFHPHPHPQPSHPFPEPNLKPYPPPTPDPNPNHHPPRIPNLNPPPSPDPNLNPPPSPDPNLNPPPSPDPNLNHPPTPYA